MAGATCSPRSVRNRSWSCPGPWRTGVEACVDVGPDRIDDLGRRRGDDPSRGHLLDRQAVGAAAISTGSWSRCLSSALSDSGAQKRVFSSASSRVAAYDSLTSIIREKSRAERPDAASPSSTAGSSLST